MARTKHTRAEMLRDPNKRKNIPTSQLPAKYRAARARRLSAARDAKNPLLNPQVALSGRNLRVAVNDLVDAETRPAMGAKDFEIQSANVQSSALANRHGQIATQVAGADTAAAARAAVISERVRQNMARIAQEGANAVDASGKAAQDALGQANTGLQGSAAERLASERAALNARQASVSTAYRSSNEALSGIDEGYQNKMAATNQARLAEQAGAAQLRQSNKAAELAAQRAEIVASRGPLRTETLMKLRQQGFENAVVGQELGVKAASVEQQERNSRRSATTQRRAQDITAANARRTADTTKRGQDLTFKSGQKTRENQRELARLRANAKDKTKPESQYSIKTRGDIDGGIGRFKELEGRGYSEAEIKRVMTTKDRVPPWAYKAIYDLARGRGLHPVNAKSLENRGVRIPKDWRRRDQGSNSVGGRGPQGLPG